METLKSGEVPALVTNVEVMRILSDRVESRRQAEEAAGTKRASRGKGDKHRHRDWVESKVLTYLQSTPCKDVDVARMPELVGKIRGGSAGPAKGGVKSEDGGADNDAGGSGDGADGPSQGGGFGLTDGETLQVLNHMPREPVELHLIVEDLPSRMSEERQEELLEVVGKYAGGETDERAQQEEEGGQKEGQDDNEDEDEEILGTIDDEEFGLGQAVGETNERGEEEEWGGHKEGHDDNGDEDEVILGTIDDEEFGLGQAEEHVGNGTRANWKHGPIKSEPP